MSKNTMKFAREEDNMALVTVSNVSKDKFPTAARKGSQTSAEQQERLRGKG